MENNAKNKGHSGIWRIIAIISIVLCVCLILALVGVALTLHYKEDFQTCGNFNGDEDAGSIDLEEPDIPGPFHDLTKHEIVEIRKFLERDAKIRAAKAENAKMNQSQIFAMDLFPARKSDVLRYLDGQLTALVMQPTRQARVVMFRGDLNPPMVEEYICGPLPRVFKCQLNQSGKRRNPVEFSLRPFSVTEDNAIKNVILPKVDKKIGYLLQESFGTSFVDCKPADCFKYFLSPIGSKLVESVSKRQIWLRAFYNVEYYVLHPVDFGLLLQLDGSDPDSFSVGNVWYHGQLFDDMDQLTEGYNSSKIRNVKIRPPKPHRATFSSLHQRKPLFPRGKPQRPPTLVEPDGRRYSVKGRKVNYLDWAFNFRMSTLSGPSLYNVQFKGERIVYELGLGEIGVFYSASNPMQSMTDYMESGFLMGTRSKSLVPGGDCPETATFIDLTFATETESEPVETKRAFCLFENNNGYPLRRHLAYSKSDGSFYGGMLDSVLTLRSALTVTNHDYIVDFILHQNGVVETRVMSTGYILPSFFRQKEEQYGFKVQQNIVGNMYHHMFHFKADIDIHGTSNRYETLDIKKEAVRMRTDPRGKYFQTKFKETLKRTEKEAIFKHDFESPEYHVVHNNAKKTASGQIKAYRIGLRGMSKQLLPEDRGNEGSIPWARYQLAVSRQKDDELVSSSPYAMFDSYDPVTNFSQFLEDDENLIDEDLVFWISQGMHHIPHTEDLPVTPTVGKHLTFFLFPFNYFDECPSMESSDQIFIHYKDATNTSKGLKVDRNGNTNSQCVPPNVAKVFDQLVEEQPDVVIESKKSKRIS